MKHLLFGLLAALMLVCMPAYADTIGGGHPTTQPISAAALPLPAGAATATKQDTGNTSMSSIDGKLPSLGAKAGSGSVSVVSPTDGFATLYTTPVILTATFTPTSSASAQPLNNLIAVPTGLSAGTKVRLDSITLNIRDTSFTAGIAVNIFISAFDADPSSSDFSHATGPSLAAADQTKFLGKFAAAPSASNGLEGGAWRVNPATYFIVPSDGYIRVSPIATGTFTFTAPTAALRIVLLK